MMESNAAYTESYHALVEVTSDFLISNMTQSEMKKEYFDFYDVYKSAESSQLTGYGTVAYVFGTLIFLSNLTVVISSGLILTKGQHSKSTYLLLGNVSLADMIAGMSLVFNVSVENPMSSNILCIFQIGMLVCPAMVSIFSVGLIAVDRYIYILHGMYYQRWFSTTKVRISILLIWMLGIVLGFLPATGWVNNELRFTRCYYVSLFPGSLILLNSLLSIVPIIVVAILYSIILVRALRNVAEIKANIKTSKLSTSEKPKMRMNRGNGNLYKNPQSVKSPQKRSTFKIKRSLSFNAVCDIKDESKNSPIFAQKSLSHDDFLNANDPQPRLHDVQKEKSKIGVHFDSKVSICTQVKNLSDPNISVKDGDVNESKNFNYIESSLKKGSRPKGPNKWRAITVVMLTSGSFIATWMPFFITVIFFVFCEEKLTNPKCMKIRILLGGPLAVLAFLNSILNPLIYAWWHKGFKRSLKLYFRRYIYRHIVNNTNK